MPCSIWMPPCASGPVLTVSRPILNGAPCACTAGIFRLAALAPVASMPLRTVLRLIVMAVHSLSCVGCSSRREAFPLMMRISSAE